MSQIKRLQTIDADTLQSTAYEPVSFVVDDLLPQGLHLLAGAPKIGKSWLALWLCLCAAQGKPLWTFATRPCEVLYLCLEDSFQRIQSRLFDLTEDAPPTLHFAVTNIQRAELPRQQEPMPFDHAARMMFSPSKPQSICAMSYPNLSVTLFMREPKKAEESPRKKVSNSAERHLSTKTTSPSRKAASSSMNPEHR